MFEDFTTGKCKHSGQAEFAGRDSIRCGACGAVATDSGADWGIARMKWFDNRAAAMFYKAHGRLPDSAPPVIDDVWELMEAVDNLLISRGMGWDLDGAFERLRVAKERVDANSKE